jgi:hypothetical protein
MSNNGFQIFSNVLYGLVYQCTLSIGFQQKKVILSVINKLVQTTIPLNNMTRFFSK